MKIYHWHDELSCGHIRNTETAVEVDRSVRVGELTVCYQCEPHDYVTVVNTMFFKTEDWSP